MKRPLFRLVLAGSAAVICLAALGVAWLHKAPAPPANLDTLGGKWVGMVVWNDASGRPYRQKMRTALFFLPHGVSGTVITFPTGAFGGVGRFTLAGRRLTIKVGKLSINGRPVPLSAFSHAPWYRDTATYNVGYDGPNLVLTPVPASGPTPAPNWPLLVSPKPLILSRRELPSEEAPPAAPRE